MKEEMKVLIADNARLLVHKVNSLGIHQVDIVKILLKDDVLYCFYYEKGRKEN